MDLKANPPHGATDPAEAAKWHRAMEAAAQNETAARHHRKTAERLEQMAHDNASGDGVWMRVG